MAVSDRLRSLAREQTEAALNTIIGIMNAPTTSDRDKLTAAFALLDRGWGKPTQVVAEAAPATSMRQLTYQIVHVTKTQEEIDNEDLVVDYHEVRTVNGNGRDRSG
jgi:hypothetical protein